MLRDFTAEGRWSDLVRAAKLPDGAYLHRALARDGRLVLRLRTSRAQRVTHQGKVEVGHDAESRLASRHTVLVAMLASYQALVRCRRKGA